MYQLKDKIRTIENRNVSFDLLRICAASMVVLLIPNLVNIFVCTVSPLADAMRYALPAVAVTPFLIGWVLLLMNKKEN